MLTDPGSTTFRAASYIDIVSPAIFLYTGVPDSGSYVLSEDWNHQFPVTTDSRFGYDLDDIAQTILVNGVSSGTAKKGDSVEFRFTNNGLHDRIYSYEFDCEDLENGTLNIPVGETRSITVIMPWDTVGLSFTDETVYTCSYTESESDEDFFTITADGEDIGTSKEVRRGRRGYIYQSGCRSGRLSHLCLPADKRRSASGCLGFRNSPVRRYPVLFL